MIVLIFCNIRCGFVEDVYVYICKYMGSFAGANLRNGGGKEGRYVRRSDGLQHRPV